MTELKSKTFKSNEELGKFLSENTLKSANVSGLTVTFAEIVKPVKVEDTVEDTVETEKKK